VGVYPILAGRTKNTFLKYLKNCFYHFYFVFNNSISGDQQMGCILLRVSRLFLFQPLNKNHIVSTFFIFYWEKSECFLVTFHDLDSEKSWSCKNQQLDISKIDFVYEIF